MGSSSPHQLVLPLFLFFALLSTSTTTTSDARAVSVNRSPSPGADENMTVNPNNWRPHSPYVDPSNPPGGLEIGGGNKRRKKSDSQAQGVAQVATIQGQHHNERNIFSRLLSNDRHFVSTPPHDYQTNSNNEDEENDSEEYVYWNADGEEEEGIDEDDDLERRGGVYEDTDDEDAFDEIIITNTRAASTSIVIEPFLRIHRSLFDHLSRLDPDQKDQEEEEEDSNSISSEDDSFLDVNADMDEDRIRAGHPWYNQHDQLPSSKQHAANVLKSQTWIIDEWDEDFEGVEDTLMDELMDWIDDISHVPARSGSDSAATTSGLSSFFSEHNAFWGLFPSAASLLLD
ncbi:hypothetical protein BGX29_009730 [Mortierella sp. GBA35]|nr:hypothetical protein BGX29_009730 [Mortierella sp. GBA35]